MRSQMASDPHSPAKFRIIGPLRNIDAWYTAFDVTGGKYFLKPEERDADLVGGQWRQIYPGLSAQEESGRPVCAGRRLV